MERTESADGTKIAFDVTGQGPALVLVVGAFCDRTSTKNLAAGLSPAFRVYEYDRRGRGDSGDTHPYAVEREVDDLAAVIAAASGSAFVFGHSSGGSIALEAAAAGVPIRRLAVYEPPYAAGVSDRLAAELAELAATGRSSEVAERFLALTGAPREAVEHMKAAPHWPYMESFATTLPYDLLLGNDGTVPVDRLGGIAVPTLALAGGESGGWAREGARVIARAVPGGQDRILPGQGHGPTDDVVIPVLTEFFI
jgi:pimeloyl-ACP methyl ester carboxylesterase